MLLKYLHENIIFYSFLLSLYLLSGLICVIIISTTPNWDAMNKKDQDFTKASLPTADKYTIYKKIFLIYEEWGQWMDGWQDGVYQVHLQRNTLQ